MAQINVTTNANALELAKKIVGGGVTIFNPVFKGVGPSSGSVSAGFFKDPTSTIGIDSGIILTNGRAATLGNVFGVNGPVSKSAEGAFDNSGDNRLNKLLTGLDTTIDATVLEFDFIPKGDSINVSFVFGSEEYPDFVCQEFNDIFAFLISGPGFTGLKNIALVPGTNYPVSINSINLLGYCNRRPTFPEYYINTPTQYLTYNAHTTLLKAKAKVQPCQVYHIVLAIADVGDASMDSGVFIAANSLVSNPISIDLSDAFNIKGEGFAIVEGCKEADIKIRRPVYSISSAFTMGLSYNGAATYGIDYEPLPSSITFDIGDSIKNIKLRPIIDNIIEGNELIKINVTGTVCNNLFMDSAILIIKDSVTFYKKTDTALCSNSQLIISGTKVENTVNSYLWNNGYIGQNLLVTNPGTYFLTHNYGIRCYNIDTFYVTNGDVTLSLGNDTFFCELDSVLIGIVPAQSGTYLWNNGNTMSAIYAHVSDNYQLKYTSTNGCYAFDEIKTTMKPLPFPHLPNDTSLCSYEHLLLNAYYPGASYLWSTGVNSAAIDITKNDMYFVKNSLNGCSVNDTIVITNKIMPVANAGLDVEILNGGSTQLHAAINYNRNAIYAWKPTSYVNYPNISNPFVSPTGTTLFYLQVTSPDKCIANDSVYVIVRDYSMPVATAFSPNRDGINDYWEVHLLESYLKCKVQVFNRSGQIVFNSIGYNKPWDGTFNGHELPTGVYHYIITPGNNKPRLTGSVTIVK